MVIKFASGGPFEAAFGYSRAIRVDGSVHVAGTTATDANGEIVGPGDLYAQSKQALKNIQTALEAVESRIEDVVRTRIYVTDISRWEEVGRAHAEVFAGIEPVTAIVEVARLISPEMLVEIEADAIAR